MISDFWNVKKCVADVAVAQNESSSNSAYAGRGRQSVALRYVDIVKRQTLH